MMKRIYKRLTPVNFLLVLCGALIGCLFISLNTTTQNLYTVQHELRACLRQ